jgi:cytochrome P450
MDYFPFLSAAAAVGVAGLALRLLLNYFTPGLASIPGPVLARSSDLWRFLDACFGQHHNTITQLHRKYGPVVRIGPNVVSVSDPAAIDAVVGLKANMDKSDSVKPMMNPYNGEVLPMLISAMDSEAHARIKRPIGSIYSMTTSLDFEHVIDDNIKQLLTGLRGYAASNKACKIGDWMAYFAFDFILQATFSRRWGFMEAGSDIDGMLAVLDLQFLYISTMGAMPWLDNLLLKNPLLLMLIKTPNTLVDFASDQVRSRLSGKNSHAGKQPDYLARFIAARESHPEHVSDLQLMTYAATNVLAASGTTSATLTTIIYHILKHQSVHEKVRTELEDARMSSPAPYAEVSKLPYLNAVILEVMRIFPTTGIELERKVGPGGLTLPSGQILPPESVVGLNAWAVHRDQAVFGNDADQFRPERWLQQLGESGASFERRYKGMQRANLAFGTGPRACLGKNLAILQVYKVIATMLQVFDVSLLGVLLACEKTDGSYRWNLLMLRSL